MIDLIDPYFPSALAGATVTPAGVGQRSCGVSAPSLGSTPDRWRGLEEWFQSGIEAEHGGWMDARSGALLVPLFVTTVDALVQCAPVGRRLFLRLAACATFECCGWD